ncbi:fungal-specific transcription factor domain-containing protein [Trichoderma austrokoningii]
MGVSTRASDSFRHYNGGVMSDASPMSPEISVNATRSSSLEETYRENLGRLTPSSSQWSRGTASVSLSHLESISLSNMMHPSHDIPSSQQSPGDIGTEALRPSAESNLAVWDLLEISQQAYDELLQTYFQNMSTFSLFYKPGFLTKLSAVSSNSESAALVASMFTFSSRFLQDIDKRGYSELQHQDCGPFPTPETFHTLARKFIANALDECSEDAPSLCVLQALILSTFHQLSQDVRGLAWRSLGVCIRVAYELNLHKIDSERIANQNYNSTYDKKKWILDEERRRAWWAIWELDAFACTVRRLPTGLDSTQTETFLPVSDEAWFEGICQPSCCLDVDPKARWKLLEECANQSWKSWYIVLNSMMRDAHLLSYCRGTYGVTGSQGNGQTAASSSTSSGTIQDGLKTLEESLSSFRRALPNQLSYHNEYLGFHSKTAMEAQSTLTNDCATYSLYMMMQLTKFMIYHYQMFWEGRTGKLASAVGHAEESTDQQYPLPTFYINIEAWNRYLQSADNILRMIRNSSPYHVRYVNPLFASTIWLAAVAQIVSKVFNPEPSNAQTSQSKLEVLQHNFDSYVSFWGTSKALQHKLNTLESRLQCIRRRQSNRYESQRSKNRNPSARNQSEGLTTSQSVGVNSGYQDLLLDNSAATSTGVDVAFDATSTFYSCGPFGLPADIVNSTWPMDLTSMKYNPSDVFNYDALDFLNYSFNG